MHSFFNFIFLTHCLKLKIKKNTHTRTHTHRVTHCFTHTRAHTHTHTKIDEVALSSFMFEVVSFPPKLKLNNFFLYIL